MTFSWDGWSDDLAGILYYEYQVFDLDKDGTQLVDGRVPVANAGNKPINDTVSCWLQSLCYSLKLLCVC